MNVYLTPHIILSESEIEEINHNYLENHKNDLMVLCLDSPEFLYQDPDHRAHGRLRLVSAANVKDQYKKVQAFPENWKA